MALHEHFREYTTEEVNQIKKDVCIKHKCPYLSRMSDYVTKTTGWNNFCSYLEWTGHMRDCMPDECTHYLDDTHQRKRVNSLTTMMVTIKFNKWRQIWTLKTHLQEHAGR